MGVADMALLAIQSRSSGGLLVAGLTKAEAQDIITQYTGVSVDKHDAAFQKFKGLPGSQQKALVQEALGDLDAAIISSGKTSELNFAFSKCLPSAIRGQREYPMAACAFSALIEVYG